MHTEEQARVINRMTNWQNTLWMRGGMPTGPADLRDYAGLVHPHHPERDVKQRERRKHLMEMGKT